MLFAGGGVRPVSSRFALSKSGLSRHLSRCVTAEYALALRIRSAGREREAIASAASVEASLGFLFAVAEEARREKKFAAAISAMTAYASLRIKLTTDQDFAERLTALEEGRPAAQRHPFLAAVGGR